MTDKVAPQDLSEQIINHANARLSRHKGLHDLTAATDSNLPALGLLVLALQHDMEEREVFGHDLARQVRRSGVQRVPLEVRLFQNAAKTNSAQLARACMRAVRVPGSQRWSAS